MKNPKPWMLQLDWEHYLLSDAKVTDLGITDEDIALEAIGAETFNSMSARLHNRVYYTPKRKYETLRINTR